jgi:hypothetical protein
MTSFKRADARLESCFAIVLSPLAEQPRIAPHPEHEQVSLAVFLSMIVKVVP